MYFNLSYTCLIKNTLLISTYQTATLMPFCNLKNKTVQVRWSYSPDFTELNRYAAATASSGFSELVAVQEHRATRSKNAKEEMHVKLGIANIQPH